MQNCSFLLDLFSADIWNGKSQDVIQLALRWWKDPQWFPQTIGEFNSTAEFQVFFIHCNQLLGKIIWHGQFWCLAWPLPSSHLQEKITVHHLHAHHKATEKNSHQTCVGTSWQGRKEVAFGLEEKIIEMLGGVFCLFACLFSTHLL